MRRLLLPLVVVVFALAVAGPATAKPAGAPSVRSVSGDFVWLAGTEHVTVRAKGNAAKASGRLYWVSSYADGSTVRLWTRYSVVGIYTEENRAVVLAREIARSDEADLRSGFRAFILADEGETGGQFCFECGGGTERWQTDEEYILALELYEQGWFEPYTYPITGRLSIR